MYVRLAFSVAAHLDPEILLVDEVLAVGDVAFQKKCMGKMDDVAQDWPNYLVCQPQYGLIQNLCQRGVFLQKGEIKEIGPMADVVRSYLSSVQSLSKVSVAEREDRRGRGKVRLTGLEILNGQRDSADVLQTGLPASFVFRVNGRLRDISLFVDILDSVGNPVTKFKSEFPGSEDIFESRNDLEFVCEIDELLLIEGSYQINVLVRGGGEWQDFLEAAAFLT